VFLRGDAVGFWDEAAAGGALIPDPALEPLLAGARRDVELWLADGLRLTTVLDEDYPRRLLEVRETPPILFYVGRLEPADDGMSVVGSREASPEGLDLARYAAGQLADRGLSVISDLAAGIDAVAHRSALDAGGRTVAFIGTGITRAYPAQNRDLQAEIGERGLVLSQFWPVAPPSKQSFPMRYASMSGYGLATIVVEAGERSGARIQARLAVGHGRPVILAGAVARTTEWGRRLAGGPGVLVAECRDDLAAAIDTVLARRTQLQDALAELVAAT
jgi:DNA processing protein